MAKQCQYVLNINSGTVTLRTPATDDNPVIFRKIDDETATMIVRGKIKAFDVVEAIEKHERNSPDFSWREYDKKRRAAEKLLNVSRREMTPVSDDPNENGDQGGQEGDEDVVSLKELGIAGEEPAAKKPKKEKAAKPKEEASEAGAEAQGEVADGEGGVQY